MSANSFFERWSKRNSEAEAAQSAEAAARADAAEAAQPAAADATAVNKEPGPPPTLEDVDKLTPQSDYSAFVARGVDEDVKRAALKKLFTDPHFNVMDGLDIYIDDYSKPDPIPPAMLAALNHAKDLLNPLAASERRWMTMIESTPPEVSPSQAETTAPQSLPQPQLTTQAGAESNHETHLELDAETTTRSAAASSAALPLPALNAEQSAAAAASAKHAADTNTADTITRPEPDNAPAPRETNQDPR